jgi:hypothetical protein
VCRSSSFDSCLMTAYPRRCRRSSPEPPAATIHRLRRRAPSSRPASATSMVSRHLGETHHPSPCLVHAPWSPLACAGHLPPPRPPVSRSRSRRRVGFGHGDHPARRAGLGWLGHSGRGQPGRYTIQPSELSGPLARERHKTWAECEARYCAAILIIF